MKHGYWKLVNKIIRVADVVVEVLDARFPELARVHKLEKFVKNHNKVLILAVNKADLISAEALFRIEKEYSKENFVLLSAKNSKGINNLRSAAS
jgi:small GTP-binding protein